MTFHPSGLRERPSSRPTRRPPSEKEKSGLRSFVSRCCRCFLIFFCAGATEEEDLMCVCQTICQIQLFFFLSVSHRSTLPLSPPSRSKGCDSESRSVCWGNYTYMGCLRTEFVLCFGIESPSLYSNLSRISPKWNNMALVCPQFDLCKKQSFQNENLWFK